MLDGDEIDEDGAEDNEENENMLMDLISEDIPMEILSEQEVREPNTFSYAANSPG